MRSFFQDEFMYSRLLKRLKREVQKEQLDSTIKELSYINELQKNIISRSDFTPSQNQELEFIKKLNNARRENLQA